MCTCSHGLPHDPADEVQAGLAHAAFGIAIVYLFFVNLGGDKCLWIPELVGMVRGAWLGLSV